MSRSSTRVATLVVACAAVLTCVSACNREGTAGEESEQASNVETQGQSAQEANEENAEDEVVDNEGTVQLWEVDAGLHDCVGVAPQKCLRVKREGDQEFGFFYSSISGFEHDPTKTYSLRVRVTPVANPPADAPSQRYELVEIVSSADAEVADDASGSEESDGTPCASNDDCGDGEMCTGPEGCDVSWTCQPMRPCTRDLRPYCSCEGETIRGSGSCPPAPYLHRGPCE